MTDRPISPETFGVAAEVGPWLGADQRAVLSVLLIFFAFALREVVSRIIHRRHPLLRDVDRRRISMVRNGTTLLALALLIVLWAPELSDFALSLTAFAVAIVIATKEFIMCLSGGLVRGLSGAFQSGDWIEVGPHSGEVAEQTLVSTTLLEIDPVHFTTTGRTVTAPNSLFLTTPVINHRHRRNFVHHEFVIWAEPFPDPAAGRAAILRGLETAAAEFRDIAERYASFIEHRMSLKLPPTAPEVHLRSTEFGKYRFECRLFCPRERAVEMEDRAHAAFYAWVGAQDWRFAGVSAKD